MIVLSAKNDDRLKAYMQSMLAFLEKGEAELGLSFASEFVARAL